ncbi:hydroxypyruvate isomerase family protein [Paludibaculum fermentans]|uniref:TIM barrel protein n=1 Tax=Paludibaculum fermentans TaxID=1473598 RepID=A0A7S7NS06_PALFE|nr:TIM barrel protein [Paludibaculum fermentans]QOY88650.1 TIM barrel protein [Paludibaculum fermentans]
MKRRTFLPAAGLSVAAMSAQTTSQPGKLKQSVCRWCYSKVPIEELAAASAKMGIESIDLVDPKEWDVVKKHGLKLTVVPGPTTIPDGLNRKESHDAIEAKFKTMVDQAVAAQAVSIIVFSGNRKGMQDEEGAANTIIGLNRLKKYAEDKGILVVMELLNSKVNHKDYMCDKSQWGIEVVKAVNSPNVKLLYDIYHMQIMEGDVIRTIRDNHQWFGHYHTGGNPGRNEIDDTQELNYRAITKAIIETGFQGYMAHEFVPKREPLVSLREAVDLCRV